ncbi:nitric oxide reductase NorD protein [Rhodoblastus acidophilus]|uniref:Nitric oxide reductase NorD protein n=1 Tax=Rhodoblastus acidophilus TaxID=1074 RepID=A0A212R8Y2_RHOAC|nr:VWA domain-containing protein [Rhodoblastus acidophilus]PPQ37915.1 VWA domain-containing protein [Rhodoblastus acidophilus]RAI24024.1 VWA domain-containing protein [Rhodoblastus acidophilus]SNB68570.1 nitric oxide reductase NorD protein [Rhodoblastus acidophilus]
MSFLRALKDSKFWEPEEAVGTFWDRAVQKLDAEPRHSEAAVALASVKGSLGVLFRGLGGEAGVEIKACGDEVSEHRRSWRRRLARDTERVKSARFDGVTLFLPRELDVFPDAGLNRQLYLWLAALAVVATPPNLVFEDPLQRDIVRLRCAHRDSEKVVAAFAGLRAIRNDLYAATLTARAKLSAPPVEAELENWICARLAQEPAAIDTPLRRALAGDYESFAALTAPPKYRPCRPVLLWGERAPPPAPSGRRSAESQEPGGGGAEGAEETKKARRQKSDQAERKDSLLLYRFESLLSFGDFLNLNRHVEDEDEDNAKKAAQDAERIDVAQHSKKPRTRLKFDLDLAPEDGDREKFSGKFIYPEWDWKKETLVPGQARILENVAEEAPQGLVLDAAARKRINAVKKQFETLRPKRRVLGRQIEGSELDLDEILRARADRRACGASSDRLYRDARNDERDLAVAVLFDGSRSTESAVQGRPVIAVAREALVALARGLDACDDDLAIYAFSSLKREKVFFDICKQFDEPFGPRVDARIAGLKPGFYTRIGAALRHASFKLSRRPNARKLLLLISDGKPNDLDHYEGRYGVEDTRRAVMEARRLGQSVFCVAIDSQRRASLQHLFGPAGFALVSQPEKLATALPAIYRHLVR